MSEVPLPLPRPAVTVQLAVADLGSTEAFYGGILELPVCRGLTAPGAPEHLILEQDGLLLIFVDEGAVAGEHPVLREKLEHYPKGVGVSFHIAVSGIEGTYAALLEENLEILYPLRVHPYGIKDIWCYDPDGYLIVLEEKFRK